MSAMKRFPESPGTILRSGDTACREFTTMISAVICMSFLSAGLVTADAHAATSEVVEFVGDSADKLQRELLRHAGTGRIVCLAKSQMLTCTVREDLIEGEPSVHALLIPAGVELDLNDGVLLLELRSKSYRSFQKYCDSQLANASAMKHRKNKPWSSDLFIAIVVSLSLVIFSNSAFVRA